MATAYDTSRIILPQGAGYKSSTLYAWNPQQKQTVDFDVVRATTATRVNQSGLIESVAANVPRIDYTNGGCGELLVEPQRTNLLTYSNDLTQSPTPFGYRGLNAVAYNSDDSPEAGGLSSLITEDTSTGAHDIRFFPSYTSGSTYTYLFLVKAAGRNKIRVSTNSIGIYDIDLVAQTISISGVGSNKLGVIKEIGNSWYFVKVQGDSAVTASDNTFIALRDSSGNTNYTGDGTSGIRLYGLTFTEGINDSVIPTSGSAVTRNADVISLSNASALLGDSKGSLFVEASWFDVQALGVIGLNGGNAANRFIFGAFTGKIRHILNASSSPQVAGNGSLTVTPNTFYKIATRYAVNDYAAYIDGSSDFTDTTLNTFSDATLTEVDFSNGAGNDPFYGRIRQLVVFDQALTDAELAAITS